MPSAKKSAAERAVQWFLDNPGAKVSSVAERFNLSIPYVYKLREKAAGKTEMAMQVVGKIAAETVSYDALATGYAENLAKAAVQAAEVSVSMILGSRAKDYGAFRDNARLAQALKRALAEHADEMGSLFADDQWEAIEMIASKLARIVNGDPNKADSWDDIAGYATLVAEGLRGKVQ